MKDMAKTYSPNEIEDKWYKKWEKNKYFAATLDNEKEGYSIVIPPPNVTGILHMGHVLNNSIQDTLVRWKRMSGYNTLWMPGTDHAGIATQNKVERKLATENLTKEDLGREKFIEEVWKWKEEHGGIITKQLRKLGASLDWDRERFTMDEGLSDAVKEIFIKLYEDGLIYQGEYMVNWCPRCTTALADDEVEHIDKEGRIWEIKYPIKDSEDYLVIATTRPETMLGDTGVAVHPEDERYKHLIGKSVVLPLLNREISIVADDYVDMEFGTGVVKMTPAHDPNDFEVGERQNLEILNIMTDTGKINENGGKYKGLDRFEARKEILKDLEELGLLVGSKVHNHAVGHCYRCDTVVEPRVSKQWFVKMKPLAEKALEVVRNGEVKIIPKRWEKVYFNWLENIRDWCISRQIWWGHRIPAYYAEDGTMFVARNMEEAKAKAKEKFGKEVELTQETDVLDTWFSSALWPFSTMGWPEKTPELDMFYPTATIVTGADILFFWIARMIMMGLYEMKEVPFKTVYLHGIVRDEQGRKMSKSLGNSPDPLDLIEKYGADAIRFTMIYNTSQGQDVFFSEKLIEMGRNFANKIWNASRFVLMNLEGFDKNSINKDELNLELVDKWIYSRLNTTIKEVNEKLEKHILDEAAKIVYEFLRGDFCDWYVEIAKIRLYNSNDEIGKKTAQYVLWDILEKGLRLLHPFMPFITEEIWQNLNTGKETIMLEAYPVLNNNKINKNIEKDFEYIQTLVSSIRNIRAEMNISPAKDLEVLIKSSVENELKVLEENSIFIKNLAKLSNLKYGRNMERPASSGFRVANGSELYVPLEGILDLDAEIKKITMQIEKIEKELAKVNGKLNNEKFVSKAPTAIIEREKKIQKEYEDKLSKLKANLESFK
ncbi:valyl-tRNA synthetase [Hypnocyclicus thermotrophus]|uniref:Valine--tRNA ligase n=1 Tax=Hypnocyclicus thermotrophus TaxID=1627895 RepID=A0AA46I5B2_9FUSO|nr:valine--tRNA ligase [Hypnocyclicus thermotrophus]TDT69124.1 valyl-tRNA synthetase [Hypnocyclicus thermotrophus]